MNPLLIPLISQLGLSLANAYATTHGAQVSGDMAMVAALLPTINNITAAISATNSTLQLAHTEGWTADDARWDPVIAQCKAAQSAALSRLT